MVAFLKSFYSLFRCPLNHDWKLIREAPSENGLEIEQVCLKCGKQTKRVIAS